MMLQTHAMILWANPRREDFDRSADQAYRILLALKEYGPELGANYLLAMRKKDAKEFDVTYEALSALLRQGISKEGALEFPELGYHVRFFSSLVDEDAAGISVTVGTTHPEFVNSVVVDLPDNLPIHENSEVCERLVLTFKKCVNIFEPFWGCVGNKVNVDRFGGYWAGSMPTTVLWINYFGKDVARRLGVHRIEQSPMQVVERLNDGYFVRLRERPIDDESEQDVRIQKEANAFLGLKS